MMIANSISNQYAGIQAIGQTTPQTTGAPSNKPVVGEVVNLSQSAQQMQQKELNIASKYDVTNMSEKEMISMAGELKDGGLIDMKQYLMMSIDYSQIAAEHLGRENMGDVKKNFIADKKSSLDFAINHGTTAEDIKVRNQTITTLERMQRLRLTA